ncbi:SDR family oxidoreductase [Chitinophaga agrisoli]|uniref:SDR family oxidoreductase n=1 Tax=Chitinophaga agrisoli TaxID=2607653 RepID=A0A5B2VYA9_9BACT|nr:SDR family oxidoreductase [Chitinophaga agrisoli]KAA2243312.1 SDR family oxidoreductase [Chitinophaga agrisoli]
MSTLTNKVVLITGASRGIGATMALHMAKAGAKVIVNYAGSQGPAEEVVATIKANGGEAIAVQADVSKSAEVKALFDAGIAHFGRIDVLVNNAGIMITKLLKDTTDEDVERQFDINVKGVFYALREAATRLADNGSVINFGTTIKRLMVPTYSTYTATKAAVDQMSRVFAKEVGARGINVNTVSPGPTNTELFLKGKPQEVIDRNKAMAAFNRLGEPEDIAKVVVFLASDDAKWIDGQDIAVNGGVA